MREQVTEILPDQFIELSSGNEARSTLLITTRNHWMALPRTSILSICCMLLLARATSTREMTAPTTHQCTQQGGMSGIVATGILLVLGKLCLHQIKLVLRDDSGNLSHSFPFLRSGGWMASMLVSHGTQSRLPMTRSGDTIAPNKDRSGVDRIAQNAPHCGLIPAPFPARGRDLLTHQILGQPHQTLLSLLIMVKQFGDHRRLGWLHSHARWVTGTGRINAIAIGRLRRGALRVPPDTSADARVASVRQSSCVHIRPPRRGFGSTTDHAECDWSVDPETRSGIRTAQILPSAASGAHSCAPGDQGP